MGVVLDHTIVPAKDKEASAKWFAEIFGLPYKRSGGHFAAVKVNDTLTFDFGDAGEGEYEVHHYAFHITDAEFDAILARVKAKGITIGSEPWSSEDGKINRRQDGRGFYFRDPNGHMLEVMTKAQTVP